MSKAAAAVDTYIAAIDAPKRALLSAIRDKVRSLAPEAEELISYGMPAFKWNGPLLYYGAFKDHCSLFPGNATLIDAFADELTDFKTMKGTIRFTPEKPLPDALVEKIIKARIAENGIKATNQGQKSYGRAKPKSGS